MEMTPPPAQPFVPTRAYPRLNFATPLVIEYQGRSYMGTTEDIAIGGLGAHCDTPPPNLSELELMFNLPTGSSVRTRGIVRYVLPNRFGVQFTGLPAEARQVLEEYTRKVLGYVRRSGRIAKRIHVTLRSTTIPNAAEELGETVILSRNGGRLVCRARFKIGEELRLYWPERHRDAEIRVIFRQLCGTGDLTDLGFEFVHDQNFWGLEPEPNRQVS
jgi:PilZ domain